jgi:large subunit ribosomal protein L4
MIKAPSYTIKGTKTGEFALPRDVFEAKVNPKLLAQAIYVYEDRAHPGLRKAKTRAEVNRTGKKLYKQKGTGGARHGSRRANLFVGGGVALGPRPVRRILHLSKSIKDRSRKYAFSVKANQKEIVVASGISKIIKTKEAASFLAKISKDLNAKRFTFILSEKAREAGKFLKNLNNSASVFYKDASAYDVFGGGFLVLDQDIFETPKKVVKPAKKAPVRKVAKK